MCMCHIIAIIAVTEVNTLIESSREPPFYVGTSLKLTCKVDIPNTVNPRIISSIRLWKTNIFPSINYYNYHDYFNPLDRSDDGTYACQVCLTNRRNRNKCYIGNETFIISGELK